MIFSLRYVLSTDSISFIVCPILRMFVNLNLFKDTFDNIGKFTKITKNLDINADRGHFWFGRLTDVRKNETNPSAPFSFPEFDPDKI